MELNFVIGYGAVIIIVGIIWFVNNRRNIAIGNIGEDIVRRKLDMLNDGFVVLSNVKYKKCQIDHLVINHAIKIIFVIEVKYWAGDISGKKDDRMWKVEKDGQVKYYNNPLMQNKYHCNIVRQKYSGYSIRSIVVFVRCKSIPRYRCIVSIDDLVMYITMVSNKVYNRGIIDSESDWLSKRPKSR